ncbi:MAG: hypothetical protein Q8L55_09900 [Phycisphaerales bacterium]|nr:hypothetical protein [Phycisphaerales bacterium]
MVLRHPGTNLHLAIEFKRVNPALSVWAFGKAPLLKRARNSEEFIVDRFVRMPHNRPAAVGMRMYPLGDAYHVAVVARGEAKGENSGHQSRNDIEDAATQACAGVNGLLEHWAGGRGCSVEPSLSLYAAPVIVTTADLYVINRPLVQADIATGNLALDDHDVQSVDWLYYQYPTSPGLRAAGINHVGGTPDLCHMLDALYLRTIPIVRSTAFARWLGEGLEWDSLNAQVAGQ